MNIGYLSKYKSELYGLSIIWIMMFHGYAIWEVSLYEELSALHILLYGNMGVEIFIFLGAVGSWYSFSRDDRILAYYWRRLKRLYLPVLFICIPYWIFLFCTEQIHVQQFILNVTLTSFWINGKQQIWFISVILVLYLLFPLLYKLYCRCRLFAKDISQFPKNLLRFGIPVLIVILIICSIQAVTPEWYGLTEIGLNRFPVFLLGLGLAPLVKKGDRTNKKWWILIAAILVVGAILLEFDVPHEIWRRQLYEAMGVPLALFFAALISVLPEVLRKILDFFGQMSLELYLSHIAIIGLAAIFAPNHLGNLPEYFLILIAAVIVAWVAHLIIQLLSKKRSKYFGISKRVDNRG